ncbi:type II toxin-antitoxin system HicB family antitoxin [Ensifer sp. MJa1]|uniref:type II toxin-antitoxin system HicB family antitoxin n=1 Tax=Ensifer sp. MJa1 TaxID=2919888 RepID=UPI003009132F
MSTISYKGYQASVEYSDGKLFVKVLHIDDLLVAQCDSAAEVEGALSELIEEYLRDCAELGREPTKPFKGSFNVRTTPELHRKAAMRATEAGVSLNAWIGEAISEKLEKHSGSGSSEKVPALAGWVVRDLMRAARGAELSYSHAHSISLRGRLDWENEGGVRENFDVARLISERERPYDC